MRRAGYTTMLDPFEQRYGKRIAAVLFIPALLGEIFWSAATLAALGMTFATIMDLDVPTAILISAAVCIGYTVVGGLWSVAYTDVVQVTCILIGLAVAVPFAAAHAGGVESALARYLEAQRASHPFPGYAAWKWLDVAFMLILGGVPWQVYFQRVLASRDETMAVTLSFWAGLGCLLMAAPAAVIGVVGATVDWQSAGAPSPASPAMVLPYVIRYLTPPAVGILALGAVAAAVMSSVDSSVLSASSLLTWNVYRPLLRRPADTAEIRFVLRVGILLAGAAATLLALTAQSVYILWYLCSDLVYVILFPQLVLVLFSPRMDPRAVVAGILAGTALRLGGGEQDLGLPGLIPYPMGEDFPVRTVAMLANLGTTWTLSMVLHRSRRARRRGR
jgi:high affinity choline transporter 7